MSTEEDKSLDNDALEIYQALSMDTPIELEEIGSNKQQTWQLTVIELLYYFGLIVGKPITEDTQNSVEELARCLNKIVPTTDSMPDSIVVRSRGIFNETEITEEDQHVNDFVCIYGDNQIDKKNIPDIGDKPEVVSELGDKFKNTANIFSLFKINSLKINLNDSELLTSENLLDYTTFFSKFFLTAHEDRSFVVTNNNGQPDPNLSLTAAINKISPIKIQTLADSLTAQKHASKLLADKNNTQFDVIFGFDRISKQLKKPPITINNIYLYDVIKTCYDPKGQFLKDQFEKNMPYFIQKANVAFPVLWDDFKNIIYRKDRIAYLASLRFYLSQFDSLEKVLHILAQDFLNQTDQVQFSDRNLVILANFLVRRYNKEKNLNIESIPEEVILCQKGLRKRFVNAIADFFDENEEQFLLKMKTLQKQLFEKIPSTTTEKFQYSAAFLFALEREIYLFLSLVGGSVAKRVIIEAISIYGNFDSELHQTQNSHKYGRMIIQNLQILVRGLGKIGNANDVSILMDLKDNQSQFTEAKNYLKFKRFTYLLFQWVEKSINYISECGQSLEIEPPPIEKSTEIPDEEKWKPVIVDFILAFANNLNDPSLGEVNEATNKQIDQMISTMKNLYQLVEPSQAIIIEGRPDFSGEDEDEDIDYVVRVGELELDSAVLNQSALLNDQTLNDLKEKFTQATDLMYMSDIYDVKISVNTADDQTVDRFIQSIRFLSQYFVSVLDDMAIVVTDEDDIPDPNLSLFAHLNNIPKKKMKAIASKISQKMNQSDTPEPIKSAKSPFHAIFLSKKLKNQYIRPPIELVVNV